MKTIKKILIYSSLLFFISCSDTSEILTVINSDGSCRREITENADSAFMTGNTNEKNNPFPMELDSTWTISWRYKESDLNKNFPIQESEYKSIIDSYGIAEKKPTFTVYAVKNYKTVDEMFDNFNLKDSHTWKNMDIKHEFNKKFKWFYTHYTYKETYPKIELDFDIPIEDYMTDEEAGFWFNGKPDLLKGMNGIEIREYVGNLEDKYYKWIDRNIWNKFYQAISDNYDLLENPPIPKEKFISLKDSIFKIKKEASYEMNYERYFNEYFDTKTFSILWENENSPMSIFEENFNTQDFIKYQNDAFDYKLIMPGELLYTNGTNTGGDTLKWNLTAYRMYYKDYIIEAQSRKLNIWTFLIVGLLILTTIFSYIIIKRKSKIIK